jgi:hypothetical protein
MGWAIEPAPRKTKPTQEAINAVVTRELQRGLPVVRWPTGRPWDADEQCAETMKFAGVPCARAKGHAPPHRSEQTMERRRASRKSTRVDR